MGFSETTKTSLITGLALLAPLVITFVAIQLVFGWLRGFLNPIIESADLVTLSGNIEIVAEVIALCLLLAGIALLGYLAQRSVGIGLFSLLDRLIGLIPMVSVIYTSVRQVSNALMERESRYESVALVEYPREGIYSIGFLTSESPRPVKDALGKEVYNVYFPNSPNPTQGRFALVPEDQVHDVDMSVSQSIRLLVTTGIAEDQQELAEYSHDLEAFDGEKATDGD